MKRLLLLMLLLITVLQGYSQNQGISYQAVILNPETQGIPGLDVQNNILANTSVGIQFTITDASGNEEYQESHSTSTDRYGMINLLIGSGNSSYSSFLDIVWGGTVKKLKVAIDFKGGTNYSPLSEQNITYMPQPVNAQTQQLINDNTISIGINTAKVGLTSGQTSAITANTAKTGVTSSQSDAITANTAKTGITSDQSDAIIANTAKAGGVTSSQSDAITANTSKVGVTSSQSDAITANTAKTGITSDQSDAITANTAKAGGITSDQSDAITANTAKTVITSDQSDAITANTAKVGVPTAYTLASSDGTNGQVLKTNGGGTLTWTTLSAGMSGSGTANYIPKFDASSTVLGNSLIYDDGSKIGIGTTNPGAPLHISAATDEVLQVASTNGKSPRIALFEGTNRRSYLWYSIGPNSLILAAEESGSSIILKTSNTEQMKITGSGNVGIGTTAPSEKLDVAGNINASGTITAGAITIPNIDGSANQVLQTNGSGALSWVTAASGGGGSITELSDALVEDNSIYIGNDPSSTTSGATYNVAIGLTALGSMISGDQNVAVGYGALSAITSGSHNTASGYGALTSTTIGNYNSATGFHSLASNNEGSANTAMGVQALYSNTEGALNAALGNSALYANTTGTNNAAFGKDALNANTIGTHNTAIGYDADVASNNLTNTTAIGNGATVVSSNTMQLGNTDVTNVKTSGTITAGVITYPNTDGSAGQVLTANGNGIASWSTAASASAGPVYGSSVVLQNSSSASTDSQIDLPGLSFRWNNGDLEIKGESGNNPQALMYYFSYHTNANATINFKPSAANSSTSSWSAVGSNTMPAITGYYAVYEFDFSVYPLNTSGNHYGKTYNIKIFLGGWGGVSMRARYN